MTPVSACGGESTVSALESKYNSQSQIEEFKKLSEVLNLGLQLYSGFIVCSGRFENHTPNANKSSLSVLKSCN